MIAPRLLVLALPVFLGVSAQAFAVVQETGSVDVRVVDSSVGAEWALRELALDGRRLEENSRSLADPRWPVRHAFVEACRRRALIGEILPEAILMRLRDCLGDPHPNVCAKAVAALDAAGAFVPSPEQIERLAGDPLPAVRIALASGLAGDDSESGLHALERLLEDADPRVARAARYGVFFHHGEAADGLRSRLLLRWGGSGEGRDEDAFLSAAEWLEAGAGDPDLLRAQLAAWEGEDAVMRRNRALCAALLLGREAATGQGAGNEERASWVRSLAQGWEETDSPRRARLLLGAARAHSFDLDDLLLEILVRLVEAEAGEGRVGVPAMQAFPVSAVARAVIAAKGPGGALRARRSLRSGVLLTLIENLPERLWAGAHGELLPVLFPPAPEAARRALIGYLGSQLRRDQDPESGVAFELLTVASFEEDIGPDALRTLLSAADRARLEGGEDVLVRAWSSFGPDERRRLLASFPRGVAFPSLRYELLRLGESPGPGRRAAVELLAAERGAGEVTEALRRWSAEDLDRFERAPDERSAHRIEVEVRGDLRALGSQDPGGSLELLARGLSLSGSSKWGAEEIGKSAAAVLGKSAAGRQVLIGSLNAKLGRRTFVEAALGLLRGSETEARIGSELVVTEFDGLASDLGVRVLAGLARSAPSSVARFLEEIARDPARAQELRMAAVEGLGERGDVRALARVLARTTAGIGEAGELDPRRVAIRMLGRVARGGGDQAVAAREELERLSARLRRASPGEDELARERRELLAESLLGVLGRLDPLPRGLAETWLAIPLGAAEGAAAERFEGGSAPDPGFLWRGELECGAALLEGGHLREALVRSGPWVRIDPSFLLALGEQALGATVRGEDRGAEARLLLRAAAVGYAGFGPPTARGGGDVAAGWFEARARLLGLALQGEKRELAQRLAGPLLEERFLGEFPESVWRRVFGERDLVTGEDPVRTLRALMD